MRQFFFRFHLHRLARQAYYIHVTQDIQAYILKDSAGNEAQELPRVMKTIFRIRLTVRVVNLNRSTSSTISSPQPGLDEQSQRIAIDKGKHVEGCGTCDSWAQRQRPLPFRCQSWNRNRETSAIVCQGWRGSLRSCREINGACVDLSGDLSAHAQSLLLNHCEAARPPSPPPGKGAVF